jgi:hypothetical protein
MGDPSTRSGRSSRPPQGRVETWAERQAPAGRVPSVGIHEVLNECPGGLKVAKNWLDANQFFVT